MPIIGLKQPQMERKLMVRICWVSTYLKLISKYILIKYENLLKDPINEFLKITDFIKKISEIKFEEKNILKFIKDTSFKNLRQQEELKGFKEAPENNKFFYLGPKNDWKDLLDKNIKDEIETSFKNEMQDLGYL